MKDLVAQFQVYVAEMTGTQVDVQETVDVRLPQYLNQLYALYRLKVDGRHFLGIVLREPENFQPVRFGKHLARLRNRAGGLDGYCLITPSLPSYVRQRLVERHIPFVVPGRQISWPALGAVVEVSAGHGRLMGAGDQVMPATQVVVLHALNGGVDFPGTPKTLAQRLGYTPMTLSRALDEIEAHKLGKVRREGRERLLDFPNDRRELWRRGAGLMRNAARETVRVWRKKLPAGKLLWAGETALARYSLLAPPTEPVVALGRKAWKPLAKKLETIPIPEEGTCQVQVWRYEPELLAKGESVDPFSLYLSLRNEPDERIQMALEDMMEDVAWSRD